MDYLNKLQALTQAKKDNLNALLELTQSQQESIEAENTENLIAMVEEKQVIIDKIDQNDKEYEEVFAAMKETMGISSLEGVKSTDFLKLQDETRELVSIINSIQDLEKENSRKLQEQMNELKTKMKQVQQGKQSIKGYGGKTPEGDGHFIDKKR